MRDPVAPEDLRRRTLAGLRSTRTPDRRWRRLGVAVCVLVALAGVLAHLLAGPGERRGFAEVTRGPGAVRATLRRTNSYAELSITGLVQPPIGEVYEVWLVRAGSSPYLRPTDALFTVTNRGTASVEVPGSLRGTSRLLVTNEPIGGSPAPTGAAALTIPLANATGD